MMSAVTREYAERTSESKTSLGAWKLNKRKRDSEAYQIFVSESFYISFRVWTKFIAVSGEFLCCFYF